MNNQPLVSVALITYNQDKYITQCLEGMVHQQTTFPYEIVIGEDCSTDNTRAICIEYQKKYPDLIRLILHEKNQGMIGNWVSTINNCTGKYIAICEGDDYWIDNQKLQKQADFLESNPDFSMCAHAADILDYNYLNKAENAEEVKLDTEDVILQDWGIMTASIVFRKSAWNPPKWFFNVKNADYALQLLASLKGKVELLPDVMSVYRKHIEGISVTLQPFRQATWMAYLLYEFNKYTNYKYKKVLRKKIKRLYKNQLQFAKDYNLRRAIVKLKFFQFVSIFFPYSIRHFRK